MAESVGRRPTRIAYLPGSHLDLYWLGSYRTCLDRGAEIIDGYLQRCLDHPDETFLIETVVFTEHFLRTHPDREAALSRLLAQGRVEIGAAYVDVWESLVLGESHLRNLQYGRRWLADRLGYRPLTSIHPDLPSLNAQTPQLCRQCGIEFYATARKIFGEGRVWRAVGPDGSALLVLRWPGHYNFIPLELADLPADRPRWGDWQLSMDDLAGRFPLGTIPVSGTAGDLTVSADFEAITGQPLAGFIEQYRRRFPELRFGYSTPAAVLAPYAGSTVPLAETRQPVPSVWGVAADESADFFRRGRRAEALLLTAETAAALALFSGRSAIPPGASGWKGTFHEDAYFAVKDPIPAGSEFAELWRMHLFTQDHNGGGQEGALSSYHKRIRQDRVADYSRQIIGRALGATPDQVAVGGIGEVGGTGPDAMVPADRLLAFNPGLTSAPSVDRIAADSPPGAVIARWVANRLVPGVQRLEDALGRAEFALAAPCIPQVGVRLLAADDLSSDAAAAVVRRNHTEISVSTPYMTVIADRRTGRITVTDPLGSAPAGEAGRPARRSFGRLRAVPEIGNDVTLRTDESGVVEATPVAVEVVSHGPLATQLRIVQDLLDVRWIQLLTVWTDGPRMDLEVGVRWPGTSDWQIRLGLAGSDSAEQICFGTPFHATRWTDVPAGAGPAHTDEIDPADYPRYRETQHWVHIEGPDVGLTVTGDLLGLHRGADLTTGADVEAVLLRTPRSCGDEHFVWHNAGAQLWRYQLHSGARAWTGAGAPELGERAWRGTVYLPAPGAVAENSVSPGGLLTADGDPVILSALYRDGDATCIRIANLRPAPAAVELSGPLLTGRVDPIDLTGRTIGDLRRIGPDRVEVRLPAWHIQTVRATQHCGDDADEPVPTGG
jgi:hypothetical protein